MVRFKARKSRTKKKKVSASAIRKKTYKLKPIKRRRVGGVKNEEED